MGWVWRNGVAQCGCGEPVCVRACVCACVVYACGCGCGLRTHSCSLCVFGASYVSCLRQIRNAEVVGCPSSEASPTLTNLHTGTHAQLHTYTHAHTHIHTVRDTVHKHSALIGTPHTMHLQQHTCTHTTAPQQPQTPTPLAQTNKQTDQHT